jgi:chemotaxis protein CheX
MMPIGDAPAARSADLIDRIEMGLEAALQEIFSVMFKEKAEIVDHAHNLDSPHISSVVGFTGRLSGLLALHFSADMACRMASRLLGTAVTQPDENVRDAVAELSNMLAGGLKKRLSGTDNMFKISIPTVIVGMEYSMHPPANSRQVWLGVDTGSCRFRIRIVLEQE